MITTTKNNSFLVKDTISNLIDNNNQNNDNVITLSDINEEKEKITFSGILNKMKNFFSNKNNTLYKKRKVIYLYWFANIFMSSTLSLLFFLFNYDDTTACFVVIPTIIIFFLFLISFNINFGVSSFWEIRTKIKNIERDINRYLPLSSKELIGLIKEDNSLKKPIFQRLEGNGYVDKSLVDYFKSGSKGDHSGFYSFDYDRQTMQKQHDIIMAEQKKIFDPDVFNKNKYLIEYKIDNGPILTKIFEHDYFDEDVFREYLDKICVEEYSRKGTFISSKIID